MKYPMSKSQQEIYDYIVEFYKEYPDRRPTLRDMATGVVGEKRVCKERVNPETCRRLCNFLHEKGYLERKFYRNVAYWVPTIKQSTHERAKVPFQDWHPS